MLWLLSPFGLEGGGTKHIFVVGSLHRAEDGSYAVVLQKEADVEHAREIIFFYRSDPPVWTMVRSLPVSDIVYGENTENRDYLQDPGKFWSWRAEFGAFVDYTWGIYDVRPAWVECCGEAAGQERIGTWSYTIIGEVPLSYEYLDKKGNKNGWFGWYNDRNYPWIYHAEHKWVRIYGLDPQDIWIWDTQLGFLWTTASLYPWYWSSERREWIWYEKGSNDPRWFYLPLSEKWISDETKDA